MKQKRKEKKRKEQTIHPNPENQFLVIKMMFLLLRNENGYKKEHRQEKEKKILL